MKTFNMPRYGITINVFDNGLGEIHSKLSETLIGCDPSDSDLEIQGVVNTIESLLLAHACSGVDILSNEYRTGLDTGIEAITNNL